MNLGQGLASHITTGDGMFTIDQEQRITSWNETAAEILGYSSEEAIGQKCWELLRGCTLKGRPICRDRGPIISQAALGKRVRNFNVGVRHRAGHTVLINLSTMAVASEKGEGPCGVLHLFHPLQRQPTWPGMLRIYLLGPVQVQRADGSMVTGPLWKRVKVRALLAHLAIQERRPVERETLLELFWPDLSHEAALRNLNTTVYHLRHSLEPELESSDATRYVFYDGGLYWLGGSGFHWLDAKAFLEGIQHARIEVDKERAIVAYKKALALYRGDYLADLSITPVWSPGEQFRYQESYLSALEELGTSYEERGLRQEARETYLQAVSAAPWRETAARKLIRLLLQMGDKAGALQQCQRLQAILVNDLGVKPSQETHRICQEFKFPC